MPNNRNAKKTMRQDEKRRARNRSARSMLRSIIKKLRTSAEAEGASDSVQLQLRTVTKKLDQAAAKNLIHANAASRTKSRLAKFVNGKGATAASAAPKAE